MSKDELLAFERDFDEQVRGLPLLQLPIRTVVTGLYMVIDGRFHGHRMRGTSDLTVRTTG